MKIEKIADHKCFGGTQCRYHHFSEALSCYMHFSIFLPEQAQHNKVPLLYWLSGLTCSDENFVHKAGAQQFASRYGVAIVSPDTSPRGDGVPDDPNGDYDIGLGAGFYLNATEKPWAKHYRMYDYIAQELPALIHQTFPVDKSKVGIFGHSMGGHGALTIALKNPDSYRCVSAFAPITSLIQSPWGQKVLNEYLGSNKKLWSQYDTITLIESASTQLPMLIDQGEADPYLQEQLQTELLVNACKNTHYPINVRMQPGYDHSYFFIASFIEDHIRFHADILCQ